MMDIAPDHLGIVAKILNEIVPEAEVFVFGSRAIGPAKAHSDLDLAIREKNGPVDNGDMQKLKMAFEESDLPYRVDVVDLLSVSDEFRAIVEKQAVPLRTGVTARI